MTDTIGNIDERGYLNGFEKRGFTPKRCILELVANSLDALTAAGRAEDGWIRFITTAHKTSMMDNGVGMDRTDVKNMFAMHRENHATDCSRGVSGIGAKPALYILSEKGPVNIFTRKPGNDYLCVNVPWDAIHREGRYTNMVTARLMTVEERAAFGRESGTTIEFPNSDLLDTAIVANLNMEAPPLDRAPVVFGRDCATISYQHFENAEPTIFPKYNYFAGAATDFYKGLGETTIDQYYHPATKQTRFIWNDGDIQKECGKAGSGIAKVPAPCTEGVSGCWARKGSYTIRVGLRRDPVIFNSDAPELPNASEKMDRLTAEVVGDHRVFNSSSKLVRNGQTIGTIPVPDMAGDSARANGRAYMTQRLLQCEVCFNPVSSHDNHMDREMQIQENKNQHQGEALPLTFKRIVKAAREKKAAQIWAYFESCVSAASSADESDVESIASSASASSQLPAQAPSPPQSPAPSQPPAQAHAVSIVSLLSAQAPSQPQAHVEELPSAPTHGSVNVEELLSAPAPAPGSVHVEELPPALAPSQPQAHVEELPPALAPAPGDNTNTVSGADLQILMIGLLEKLTPSAHYSAPSFTVLQDALRICSDAI